MLVRKLRLKHGWSQRQLAEMTGVTTRTIQRIERGQKPSVETAKALASVFEVDFSIFQSEQNEVDTMTSNDETKQNSTENTNSTVTKEELEAMAYAKRVKEFFEFLLVYLIVLVVFLFAAPEMFSDIRAIVVFVGIGLGVIFQGLYAFGYISFLTPDWERKLIEKRLNRKL